MLIVGRVAWKSKYSSGSIGATSSESSELAIVVSAVEAAAAASFQPRKAQTITGERSWGSSPSQLKRIHAVQRSYRARARAR